MKNKTKITLKRRVRLRRILEKKILKNNEKIVFFNTIYVMMFV